MPLEGLPRSVESDSGLPPPLIPRVSLEQRGAIYTPHPVAAAMCRWAVRTPSTTVLDPAAGDGVFLRAARERLLGMGAHRPECVGVDIDRSAAKQSGSIHADFFAWNAVTRRKFSAVLGNPPYVRSHQFPEQSRTLAFSGLRALGIRPSRLMSTWAPFVALASGRVDCGGRMALVVPEELLTISYARELRQFLLRRFRAVTICPTPARTFPAVQQATVLLLCDDSESCNLGLHVLSYEDLCAARYERARSAPVWPWSNKWTHTLLSEGSRRQVDDVASRLTWPRLQEQAHVEVGIVTGNNAFFLLDRQRADRIRDEHLVPTLSRTHQVPGTVFSEDEYKGLMSSDAPMQMLNLHCRVDEFDAGEADYIQDGLSEGVHSGFKCRNREPWYGVPSIRHSDALLFRQSGQFPRIVHFEKKCAVTDTMHRIRWRRGVCGYTVATGFLNTWTLLYAELFGRSYGGGVLELMPSEARDLPVPPVTALVNGLAKRVDAMIRRREFDNAIELVSDNVLGAFSKSERDELNATLCYLRDRRSCR